MKYIALKAENVTKVEAFREGELWSFPKWTTLEITWRMGTARYIVVLATPKGCFVKKILHEMGLDSRMYKIEDMAPESIHVVTRRREVVPDPFYKGTDGLKMRGQD